MLDFGWMGDHLPALVDRLGQHLYLAAIALAVGFALSFAIGVAASRWRGLYPPATALAGFLYTIPSLALYAAFVPITGIRSIATVEIPLVMYTQVILVRNIVAGFDAVPADVLEAAEGMGYSRFRRLWQIELPLAVPLMIAGLRIASVSTIGLVTITATVSNAWGGLGFFILEGGSRFFPTEVYFGAVPSIILALAADRLFLWLQRRLTPWSHARVDGATEGAAA